MNTRMPWWSAAANLLMAARKNKIRHDEETRAKIKSSQLINFLQNHVINGTPAGKTQITAAVALLKKTLPDLQAIEGSLDMTVAHEDALDKLK